MFDKVSEEKFYKISHYTLLIKDVKDLFCSFPLCERTDQL